MPKNYKLIETGVDRLLRLLNEHKEMTLSDAATRLKVPMHILEHLCGMLEEEGLIVLRRTLRDIWLVSKEHYAKTTSLKNTLTKHIKAVTTGTKCPEEIRIEKKLNALEHARYLHEQTIKKLRGYERMKEDVDVRQLALVKEMKKLVEQKNSLDQREGGSEERHLYLEEREAMLKEIVATIKDQKEHLHQQRVTLVKKHHELVRDRLIIKHSA